MNRTCKALLVSALAALFLAMLALVAVAALALGACSSDSDSKDSSATTTMAPDTTMAPAAKNIVETAAGVLRESGFWGVGVADVRQNHHAILRNYPIIGHLRFLLEYIRPEIRQYFIESETESAPFSRAQRSLVYARAKGQSDKRPLGTQLDVQAVGYEWITHSMAPTEIASDDMRTLVGGKDCTHPYNISLYNISAMSFGPKLMAEML